MSEDSVKAWSKSSIRNQTINNGSQSDGRFPISIKDELAAHLNNGDVDHLGPRSSPFLGDTVFSFHTGESTNRSMMQGIDYINDYRIMPIERITTRSLLNANDTNLFIGYERSEAGYKTFKYTGTYPLFTTMQGSLSWLRRMHATNPSTKSISVTLAIEPIAGLPSIELSQNSGRQFLGCSYASGDQNFQLIPSEFNDADSTFVNGWWCRKQFNICQPVEFYPNATYAFRIIEAVVGNGVTPEGSAAADRNVAIRLESGGFICHVDTTEFVRKKIQQFQV